MFHRLRGATLNCVDASSIPGIALDAPSGLSLQPAIVS